MTEDTSVIAPRASWHLWAVGIVGILWNGFGCYDFTMTVTRNEAYLAGYPQEMLAYWFAMPWWIFGLWAIGVLGGLLGSIALLLRSAWAVKLFAASLLAAIISNVIAMMDTDAPRMEGAEAFPFIIIALAAGFLAYAYWQSRRGVLR
ncbi:MAG: hypothetical protein ACK4M6_06040 [Hyphomonas sp.]